MLVAALAETPAAAAAAVMMPFYNGFEAGFMLVQKLIDALDPAAFKALMMEMAVGLVDGMAAELEAIIGSVVSSLSALVGALNAAIEGLNAQIAAINAAIEAGGLTPEQLAALQAEKTGLLGQLADHMARLQKAEDMAATAPSLLGAQKDAASCKTRSLLLSALSE
ncbi:hypothetical protein ACW73L_07520 [Methylolobus aquaticus]